MAVLESHPSKDFSEQVNSPVHGSQEIRMHAKVSKELTTQPVDPLMDRYDLHQSDDQFEEHKTRMRIDPWSTVPKL